MFYILEYFRQGLNEDFYNRPTSPNVQPHELHLKKGMECYILRNIAPNDGLLNNTPVRIVDICRTSIKVVLTDSGEVRYIPRISFTITLPKRSFSILRKQFPLRPAYAKTFNRIQGSTLSKIGIDLREDPFTHGQLFVALSRVRSKKDIILLVNPSQVTEQGVVTRNVVYKELLQ